MRVAIVFMALSCSAPSAYALAPKEIFERNSRAVVYLEVRDAAGGVVERGTGFIVSVDGYVVTAAHIKADPTQKLWAVVGERSGTSFPLTFREKDDTGDIALWQFPQSQICRETVTMSSKTIELLDPVLSLGFPGSSGLTPNSLTINNLTTSRGFMKTDGFLEPGNSGGPVFNQAGHVVGVVHGGGQPGTENNEVIPISLALNLVRKWKIGASVDAAAPYPERCFSTCRDPQHGIEGWTTIAPWSESSGWLGGGHGQSSVCASIAGSIKISRRADDVEVTSTSESTKRDVFGHVEYKYHCTGVARFTPIYYERRSAACGIWR